MTGRSPDIKSHEKTCNKRPLLNCAVLKCEKKLMLKNLSSHSETCHSTYIVKREKQSERGCLSQITRVLQDNQKVEWATVRYKFNEDYFFLESLRLKDQKDWLLWLYYPGLAQDAAKYTYT
jgi:hypothetical protein